MYVLEVVNMIMSSKKHKLGIYVFCYNEVEAVKYALNSCRVYHPDAPIYLAIESDTDFSSLSTLENISINHVEDSLSDILPIRPDERFRLPHNQRAIKFGITAFFDRLEKAIPFFNSEYIILHCPDTLIRGKLTIPDGVGLLGSQVNKYFSGDTNALLVEQGGIPINSFGAVPAIFRTDDYIEAVKLFNSDPAFIDKLCNSFYAVCSYDILLPILFSLICKSETFNPDITECSRNPNWETSPHPLLHQFRKYYPVRTAKHHVEQSLLK